MAEPTEARWLLLIHQIPPKPNYLRVKIWRRLQRLGAAAVKNSVYVLPRSEQSQFRRREVPGIDRLVAGIAMMPHDDEERLAHGSAVFEDLYEYFRRKKGD